MQSKKTIPERGANSEESELLTIQEVSDRLKISRVTIDRMRKDGTLKSLKIRKSVRIYKNDVDQLLEKLTAESN